MKWPLGIPWVGRATETPVKTAPESGPESAPKTGSTRRAAPPAPMVVEANTDPYAIFRGKGQEGARELSHQTETDIWEARKVVTSSGYGTSLVDTPVRNAMGGGSGFGVAIENPVAEALWKAWRWSAHRRNDRVGHLLEYMAEYTVRDGEAFVWIYLRRGRIMARLIDPLDIPYHHEDLSQGIRQGIALDQDNAPLRYLVRPRRETPWDLPIEPMDVPADQMVHVFRSKNPAKQIRGVSWLRTALDEYQEMLRLKRLAPSVVQMNLAAGDVVRVDPSFEPISELNDDGEPVNADGDVMSEEERQAVTKAMLHQILSLGTGQRALVFAEKDMVERIGLGSPGSIHEDYIPILREMVADLTRTTGSSYVSVSGDTREANYSVLRFAQHFESMATSRLQVLLEDGMREVIDIWAMIHRAVTPGFPMDIGQVTITLPSQPDADPVRDANARRIDAELGYRSVPSMIRADGRDPEDVVRDQQDYPSLGPQRRQQT